MLNKTFIVTLLIIFPLIFNGDAFAHPGRTASDGCHYCRTNCDKWGEAWNVRHCHGGSIYSKPVEPIITTTVTANPTPTSAPTQTVTPTAAPTTSAVMGESTEKEDNIGWLSVLSFLFLGGGAIYILRRALNNDNDIETS